MSPAIDPTPKSLPLPTYLSDLPGTVRRPDAQLNVGDTLGTFDSIDEAEVGAHQLSADNHTAVALFNQGGGGSGPFVVTSLQQEYQTNAEAGAPPSVFQTAPFHLRGHSQAYLGALSVSADPSSAPLLAIYDGPQRVVPKLATPPTA